MRLTELLDTSLPDGTKYTQEALGAEVAKRVRERDDDYTQETVSRWKTGKHNPSIAALVAIADIYDCTVDYLLGRSDFRGAPLQLGRCLIDDEYHKLVEGRRDAAAGFVVGVRDPGMRACFLREGGG